MDLYESDKAPCDGEINTQIFQDAPERENNGLSNSSQLAEHKSETVSDTSLPAVHQEPAGFQDTGLRRYLQLNTRGKEILKEYQRKNNYLSKPTRSKLVRLVIQRENDWIFKNIASNQELEKFKISKERFMVLAKEIVSIFEHECTATYYTPFQVIDKKRTPATGKLLDHYNYEKERLKNVGLVARTSQSSVLQTLQLRATSAQENEKLQYLKYNVDEWDVIVSYWDDTFEARRRELIVEKISTVEFIDNYLCLQVQRGLTLISKDFEKLYPNHHFVNSTEWIKIKTCIKNEFKEANANVEDQGLIYTLSTNTLSGDQEDFLIFYHLPCLITSTRPKKGNKGEGPSNTHIANNEHTRPVKLSLQERRETFILHVMVRLFLI